VDKLEAIKVALGEVEEEQAIAAVEAAVAAKVPATEILAACQQGVEEVGRRFEAKQYFISELMMTGEILRQITDLVGPMLKTGDAAPGGKVVFGTVQGDIHNIGKDIVISMLRSANLEVTDLGIDVPAAKFVEALKETGATVLGLSGLLTLAYDSMKTTVEAVAAAGLRGKVKIMIGGGTVNGDVCKKVGADDWGTDPVKAVRLAKQWTRGC
jgi:methanogenic corrinoid protein MtbC1